MISEGPFIGTNPAKNVVKGQSHSSAGSVEAITEDMIHTPKQVEAMLAAADRRATKWRIGGSRHRAAPRTRALLYLGYMTGMRNGELRALMWKNVDLDQSIAMVRWSADKETNKIGVPKTKNAMRAVARHSHVVGALRDPKAVNDGNLVLAVEGGGPISYHNSVRDFVACLRPHHRPASSDRRGEHCQGVQLDGEFQYYLAKM